MPTEPSFSLALLLAWPAALFLLVAPGYATLTRLLSSGKKAPGSNNSALNLSERIFWTLTLSLFFDAWASLLLAELGLFSLGAVFAAAAAYCAIVSSSKFKVQSSKFKVRDIVFKLVKPQALMVNLDGWLLALLLFSAFGLNYFALHETVVGAQDSGVYFNAGANIARTGAIISQDPLLPALAEAGPKTQPQFLLGMPGRSDRFLFVSQQRLPGFFIKDKAEGLQKGQVVPQLFHLYPALLALGMALFGLWGGLWVTPLLGVMAVFAVYLTTRRLFPAWRQRWIALLAALFLLLNAVQVWFSRETLWEVLGEFLVFTAIYAFCLMVRPVRLAGPELEANNTQERDEGAARLGGLGVGLAMGLICLAHAQFPFMIWPLLPYFIWMRLSRSWAAPQWWLLGAFGLLFLQNVLHIRIFAIAYFEGVYHNSIADVRNALHILLPVATLAFLVLVLLDAMPKRVQAAANWLKRGWPWLSLTLAAIFTIYVLYSYFIRVYDASYTDGQGNYPTWYWSWSSYIGGLTTEGPARNLLRLGWYFSPPGMLLAFLGLAAITARQLNARVGFFLALTLGVSFIFLDYNYTQEHYIYSLRRYITATIPALAIFAAYACLEALPALLNWVWRKLSHLLLNRRLAYVTTTGGPSASIAFSLTEPEVQNLPPGVPAIEGETQEAPRLPNLRGWTGETGLIVAIGLVLFLIWTGRTVFTLPEYGPNGPTPGVLEQVRQLAGQFGPKDIVIFAGERDQDAKLATPLTYAFGVPAFDLTYAVKNDELGDLLRLWEKQGYHIKALLGPNGGRLAPTGYSLKYSGETSLSFYQFQQLSNQKPNNPQTNLLTYGIFDVTSSAAIRPPFGLETGEGQVNSSQGWTLQLGQHDWPALVNGFYNAERDPDGLAYRWSETDGVLRIPCFSGSARLTLTMGAGTRPVSLPPLAVRLYLSYNPYDEPTFGDPKRLQALATFSLKPGMQDYSLDLAAGQDKLTCGERASSLILWLTVDGKQAWVPQQQQLGDDTRHLAIKLARINLASH